MTDNISKKNCLTELEDEVLSVEHTISVQSKFLMGLGHELRTPLNVILGFAQLLKKVNSTNLTDEQLSNVEEIIQSANHLVEISDETLAWSKVEMNRHSPELIAVKLSKVIGKIWYLMRSECKLKNIRFTIKLNQHFISIKNLSGIPTLVIADSLILQQGMLNIITMLVKNMPNHGVIAINIDTGSEKFQQKNVTQITIHSSQALYNLSEKSKLSKNTGLSSTPHLSHEKENEVNTRLIELSLAKAKKLIKSINGKFKVNVSKQGFELFTMELPCPVAVHADNSPLCDLNSSIESSINILYIEDNLATVRLVKQLLKNIGDFTFHSADTAQMGLEIATKTQPQLILIDINLPDYNGLELLSSLKTMTNIENTKLIAISGDIAQTSIEKALNQGFDEYITKPISIEEFSSKIRLHFNSR